MMRFKDRRKQKIRDQWTRAFTVLPHRCIVCGSVICFELAQKYVEAHIGEYTRYVPVTIWKCVPCVVEDERL